MLSWLQSMSFVSPFPILLMLFLFSCLTLLFLVNGSSGKPGHFCILSYFKRNASNISSLKIVPVRIPLQEMK